ncbi:MAG: hypothetical protein LQ346_000056 [Caloplaca aetnensis]|nr:MAG: hypothetical protein LQ346_000056 [Caloplaca aetnensis]
MKRPGSDDIMDLPSPMAKRLHLEDPQGNGASAPTTPIDDFDDDDLYGDSPAISKLLTQDTPSQIVYTAPQPPPPKSQNNNIFRLPGLGLSLEETNGLQQPLNREKDAPGRHDNQNTQAPTDRSLTAQRAHSWSNAVKVEANGLLVAKDDTQRSQVEKEGQIDAVGVNGSSVVHAIDAVNGHAAGQSLDDKETPSSVPSSVPSSEQDKPAIAPSTTPEPAKDGSPLATVLSAGDDTVATNSTLKTAQPFSNALGGIEHQAQGKSFKDIESRSDALQEAEAAAPEAVHPAAHLDGKPEENAQGPAEELPNAISGGVEHRTQKSDETTQPDKTQEVQEIRAAVSNVTVEQAAQKPTQQPLHPSLGYQQHDVASNDSLHNQQPGSRLETRAGICDTPHAFEEVAEANKADPGAEFELDSSPIEASSNPECGSDSSVYSSSDEENDKEMLDVAEEARRLMEESGGSDDEGKGNKAASGPLRTLNEKADEVVPIPQIEITPAMNIAELGSVEHVVENCILIKAKTSGERQALETGSLLCLEDRSVIGLIAETLGQVQQPYYSVRFTNAAAITEAGIAKGTRVFNVEQHSHYVFTQNIKVFKGSDASNIHDEEVGDDELEFSDDEAEAEHKRRVKQQRQAKRDGRSDRGDGFARGPRGGRMPRGGRSTQANGRIPAPPPPISYDDPDDGEDLYTPLTRPSNLHEVMGNHEAPQENLNHCMNGTLAGQEPRRGSWDRRGRGDRDRGHGHGGRGGGRGRGDRGRARGDRRGGGRGGSGNSGFNEDSRPRQYDNQRHQYPSEQDHAKPTPPPSHANQDPTFANSPSAYQAPTPYGWSTPYPNNQYRHPLFNTSYEQSASSHQQSPYTNQAPTAYEYPQQHVSNPFLVQHNAAPLQNQRQYSPHQIPSPATPVLPNIPAGAHINPAFFSPATQQSPPAWPQHQSHGQPRSAGSNNGAELEAAFKAAQDRLNLVKQLSQSSGYPL